MKSATQMLFDYIGWHHGYPQIDGCANRPVTRCYVCGQPWGRSQPVVEWMGENFTGQSLVAAPTSPLVCEACVWAMAGRPPDTLRMWCHLFDGDYLRTNKGDKPAIRDWLRRTHDAPWFAAIADSGKKHVVPFTPVNPPGSTGRIRFEEDEVVLPRSADGWAILDDASELLTLGTTKAEIEPGEYGARAWSLCPAEIQAFEDRWASLRHSAWFRLVVWLAQRDEGRVEERMATEQAAKASKTKTTKKPKQRERHETRPRDSGATAHADDGIHSGRASDLPEGVRANGGEETLGPPRDSDAHRDEDSGGPRGVGHDRRQAVATTELHQLGLPWTT